MKQKILIALFSVTKGISIKDVTFAQGIKYPEAPRGLDADDHSGADGQQLSIGDPYRFLEDPTSEQTKSWIKKENSLTKEYMKNLEE